MLFRSNMIVWGGSDETSSYFMADGGRYDPSTDVWLSLPAGDAPSGRIRHTAVWTGTEMIIWGGGGQSFTFVNSGARYDPSTGFWTPTSTAPGWHTSRLGNRWTFTDASGTLAGGITRITLSRGGTGGLVRFDITGKSSDFQIKSGELPVRLLVILQPFERLDDGHLRVFAPAAAVLAEGACATAGRSPLIETLHRQRSLL